MSSYLNIYLLPKKENVQGEPKPLFLMQWSRSSGVYQAIKENINPVFIGSETPNYSDITKQGMDYAIQKVENDIQEWKKRMMSRVDALNKLNKIPQETIDTYIQDTMDDNEYISELQDTLNELTFLRSMLSDLEYSDFEKAICNID